MNWTNMGLTAAVAAVTSVATVFAAQALRPPPQVRDYLLAHPEVIPEAMQRMQDRDTAKAVGKNRGAIHAAVGDAFVGNPKGDVTVVEYFDYNCGYCRASLPTIDALVKGDPNVRVEFRELPILSQESYDAAKVSYAAALQGKFRAFHNPLYSAGRVTAQTIAAAAKNAGIDMAAAAKAAPAAEAEIKRNIALARELGMTGTPAWVIGDKVVSGALPLEEMQAAVKAARKG